MSLLEASFTMQDYSGYGYGPDYGSTSPLPPLPPEPPRRRVGLLSYVAVALVAGALGAGSVVALYHPAASSTAVQPSSSNPPAALPRTAVPTPSSGGSGAVTGSLAKVRPGVVIINTTLQYSSERAAGTGMVINAAEGLVLTNNHVIEGSTKITVSVPALGRTFKATVLGYDVTGDISLIKLQDFSGLTAVPLGDSGKVRNGDSVTAMGNAGGQSQIVTAPGTITGVNRSITATDQGGQVSTEKLHGMFETDAGIISGDSGGPLVSASGQVIGMDTAGNDVRMSEQQPAAGFAIPINTALSVARQIAAGQASATISIGYPPFIGIYVAPGTSSNPQAQAAEQQQANESSGFGGGFGGNGFGGNGSGTGGTQSCYTSAGTGLPVPSSIAPVSAGTLVIGAICGSPAASAGLTAGSVITSVNGTTTGAPPSVHNALAKSHPGDSVSLTWVTPSGQHKTASVTLTQGPPL